MNFKEVSLCPEIHRAIEEMGFDNWTEIQEKTIPLLEQGLDVIGQSQTGTGKTIAFGIPVLQKIDVELRKPQVLILCPTRELAVQTCNELRKLTKYMSGLKMVSIYGGDDIMRQIRELKAGVQIVVGTPGRVIDHINRKTLRLENTHTIVLDEADEMLKMGFREDIEKVLSSISQDRQTILFSATMPKPIMDLTKKYQKDPVHIKIEPKSITAMTVIQEYCELQGKHKSEAISRILKINNVNIAIVFCNTKDRVDKVCDDLLKKGFLADKIHGDLTQNLRLKVLKKLEDGLIKILVATDVAARGLDIKDVELVVNYDVPEKEEYYVHRIGRSGRAGKAGRSVTLVGERDKGRIRSIEHYINKEITKINIPTLEEVKASNANKYVSDIKKVIEKASNKKIELYEHILEELKKENDIENIALALLKMSLKLTDDYELDDINAKYRDRSSSSSSSRDGRSSRDSRDRNSRDGRDTRRSDRGDDRSSSRKPRTKDGMQRIFLNVGRCHGATKAEVLNVLEKETGVKKSRIDDLDIFENFSFFTVSSDDTKSILSGVEGKKFGKNRLKAEKAKK